MGKQSKNFEVLECNNHIIREQRALLGHFSYPSTKLHLNFIIQILSLQKN